MNRSDKGFGLFCVVAAVLLLILSAVFGAKADASELNPTVIVQAR